ncbi:MAG TPA: hypothetical protein VHI13_15650 [Candidatus Kapabacteria bacterium]|nr:hypothetical protein [Candidatus Kapabacteria bacterium]
MNRLLLLVPLLALLCWSPAPAQTAGTDSALYEPLNREQVMAIARRLETDPLGEGARTLRQAAMQWLARSTDLLMTPCDELMSPMATWHAKYGNELMSQILLSGAAFLLAHPDSATDPIAVHRAGMIGCLRAYEAILRREPREVIPSLDLFIEYRDYGNFDDYIARVTAPCACRGEY